MINIPLGLREAIQADELVLFVGAGLSWNFKNKKNETLEGWTKMASSITSYLEEKRRIMEEVKQSCDKKEPIDALKEIEDNGVNKGIVGEFVKDYFSLGEGNDYSLQQKLFELSTKIITINYDTALEKAVPQLQEIKAYRGKDYELNRLKKDPIFLFKLHGCIEHIDSMVLFPSDYEKLYNSKGRDAEHALSALRNLIFNKTFLFIGTGLGDPQISSFFEEIKRIQGIYSQEHYIITLESLEKSLDFLTPIKVDSYTDIPAVIDQLLEIKRSVEEKRSLEEKLRLDQLRESEERNEVLTKRFKKVKDEHKKSLLLLEWESNNRFNRGLRHHLAGEYLEASEEYEVATILNPRNSEAFCNWGTALSDLAKTKSGSEAEEDYNNAFKKYQKAIDYKSDYYAAYYNWGIALSFLAQRKSGDEAEKLYNAAIEKFQRAIECKSDYPEAHNNLGNALMGLARTKSGGEVEELYRAAIVKYRKAIAYKPDFYETYNNWGNALRSLAQTKSGSKAEFLYNKAIDKYQKATESTLDSHEIYNNWGVALMELAKIKSDSEAEGLYDEAIEKYQQVIKYGGHSYNLACLYALRNRKEDALKYLDLTLSRGEVSVKLVEEDNDWNSLRDDPDFKRLLSRHKGK